MESSLPGKAEAHERRGNVKLEAVVGTLAKQIACDNLIPSFNISCAKNAECQVAGKHRATQRPHLRALLNAIQTRLRSLSPPDTLRAPPLSQRSAQVPRWL